MATALLIVHGLVAVALLGRHHASDPGDLDSARAPDRASFFGRFRAVSAASFANAIVVLYAVAALLGAVVYLYFRVDIRPELGACRPLAGPRPLRHQGTFRRDRLGAAASLLGVLAATTRRRAGSNARRADLDPRGHRLVGLSRRPRPEQHHGLRIVTSSPALRRFAFAYGTAFAVLYVVALKADLALFTVYPSLGIVLLGTHHAEGCRRSRYGVRCTRDVLVRLDGHCGARSARLRPGRRLLPRAMDATSLVRVGVGGSRAAAMIACVYLTMPYFRLSS